LPQSLSWLKNERPLDRNNPHYSVLSEGRLFILVGLRRTDDAKYTCVASNAVGDVSLMTSMIHS